MEEEDPEEEASGLSMTKAEAEFAVAQSKKMTEQQAILDSIRDEAEMEANRRLIWQRQAEADALFDELKAKEAAAEQPESPEGAELWQATIYSPEGMEIANISDED
ncbi:Auxin response factor 4 [Hordeum vulgare]|nr:Auxin response factor 4 [Hordeum vulgare]